MVPCGTAGALAGVLGIFGLSAVRWNASELISIEALVFWGGACGSFSLGFLGAHRSFVLPLVPERLDRSMCCWSPAVVAVLDLLL